VKISSCRLCGSGDIDEHYRGPVRSGSFGKVSSREYEVRRCLACGVMFLDPEPELDYQSGEYRSEYNDSTDVREYYRLHDAEQPGYLTVVSETMLRGKVVADIGCGGGAFLDHVRGVASEIIAVEPFAGYREILKGKGYRVYERPEHLSDDTFAPKVDVAVSFHVIEHVADPSSFLSSIGKSLVKNGVLYLATPNSEDILLRLDLPWFLPFYFRTAHPWYFNETSLRFVSERAGFKVDRFFYRHSFDLSNALCWARDRRPTGTGRIPLFDSRVDGAWRRFLEEKGMADTIWVRLVNESGDMGH